MSRFLVGGAFLVSCTGESPAPPAAAPPAEAPGIQLPYRLVWDGLTLPAERQSLTLSSPGVAIGGRHVNASWQPLLTQGQMLGDRVFGVLVDETGATLPGEPACGHADFGALFEAHGEVWHFGHVECQPGALWLTRLAVGPSGELSPVASAPVDLSGVHGGKHFCAGDVTPWGTVLSAEEYDADARKVKSDGTFVEGYTYDDYDISKLSRYYVAPPRLPHPYDHGWVVETAVLDATGATRVEKRFSLGRFSHETAIVLPDERTVYLSDDGVNGALFMFVADQAGDLRRGTLYAARFTQVSADGGGRGSLSWISLGRSDDEALRSVLSSGTVTFDDLFDHLPHFADEPCLEGYTAINDAWGAQCLRLRQGADPILASRVEARRYAALLGATTEFRKMEGISHDPDHGVLYVAFAEVNKGMVAGSTEWDLRGRDHIRIPENRCGGVYAARVGSGVSDSAGTPIPSAFVATELGAFVMGRQSGFGCAPDLPANPDNVAYIPGSGALLIAEDTGHHVNNLLWSVDVGALHQGQLAALSPILLVPPGAEVTGLHWTPNLRGRAYLTTTIQHPWEGVDEARPLSERMGVFGAFGPLPPPSP